MKLPNFPILVGFTAVTLLLPSCVPMDPALLAGGGGYGGGGYHATRPAPTYGHGYGSGYGGGYHQADIYDHSGHAHNSHSSHSGSSRYFGGPEAWYKSGYNLGKRDRKSGLSCNYGRHKSHFDSRTRSEFAHGYEEGYSR